MSRSTRRAAVPRVVEPATRSYVTPDGSGVSSFSVPYDSSDTLKVGDLVEFTTRTGTAGGKTRTYAIKYGGTTVTNVMAPGDSALLSKAPSTAAAQNLVLSDVVAADNAYYACYIHSGNTSVTFGSYTLTNPNTNVDSTSSPTEYSSQIVIVRYSLSHAVQYVYRPDGANQGIAGLGHASRRDVQSNVRLAYFSGSQDALYVCGQFKGRLNFGDGHILTSQIGGAKTDSTYVAFAVRLEEDSSRNLTPDWGTEVYDTVAAGESASVTGTIAFPGVRPQLDSTGDLYFVVEVTAVVVGDGVGTTAGAGGSAAVNVDNRAGSLVTSSNIIITTNADYTTTIVRPQIIRLYSSSGAAHSTFLNASRIDTDAITLTDAATWDDISHDLQIILGSSALSSAESIAFAWVDSKGSDAMTLKIFDCGDGTVTSTTEHTVSGATQAVMAYDAINDELLFAHGTATVLQVETVTPGADISGERSLCANVAGTFGAVNLRGIETDSASGTAGVYLAFDYYVTSNLTANDGAEAEQSPVLTIPLTSGSSEYNSIVLAATTTHAANNWEPRDIIHFDQSNTSTVGTNQVRAGLSLIDANQLLVGLGFTSTCAYTNTSGTTTSLVGNTGSSLSLSRGSSNSVVKIGLSITETGNRALALVAAPPSGGVVSVRPTVVGGLFEFTDTTNTDLGLPLTPGNNYYVLTTNGTLTTTVGSNTYLGYAIGAYEILIGGGVTVGTDS